MREHLLILLLILIVCMVLIWLRIRITPATINHLKDEENTYSFPALIAYVKDCLHELSRSYENVWGTSEQEWERKVKARVELRQALKGCTFGDIKDKNYVKSYIRDLLISGYRIGEDNIDCILPFGQRDRLTAQDRFEIVLYLYTLKHGHTALGMLIQEYGLDEPKQPDTVGETYTYEITAADIDRCFHMEYRMLLFHEKLDIIVQRIYQSYKGYSVIDEIREQRIDGVSGGVGGLLPHSEAGGGPTGPIHEFVVDEGGKPVSRTWDSIWIFYKGKSIRLSFLSFGSEAELKRVCQNIYKYNLPGQLSEANGYKVNEMKDGSRVVVVRPPFAESWAFFVRKFDVQSAVLEQLIQGENCELPVTLLKYLMRGSRVTSITGSQGSGKTTLLTALVKHIYASHTLRVQETSFELNLRKLYSSRNILSFRETEYVSGQQGLDLQKKTDGTVNILGEVATDEVAAWMIQTAQVASLFTLFTHHAKTFRDLVESLRNSLLKTGVFRDERIAELQVASIIDFDIHLRRDMSGKRYIERISECLYDHSKGSYQERVIIEYRNGSYTAVQPVSMVSKEAMIREMLPEDAVSFQEFVDSCWGEAIGA